MHIAEFIHQKSYEHIERSVRRHLVTFIPYCFLFLILLLIPLAVRTILLGLFPQLELSPILFTIAVLVTSAYLLLMCLFFYSFFINFHLDVLVVTNDRLIDIEQINLFSRTISEIDLYKIQDATSKVHGIFQTLFDYGDVHIETPGQLPKFVARSVPHPHDLRRLILDLSEKDKHFHSV